MNDPNTFENFLDNVARFTTVCTINAILGFAPTFNALTQVSTEDINQFVKDTHLSNSVQSDGQKFFLPPGAVLNLHAIHFEVRDRVCCGATPGIITPQNLNGNMIQFLRGIRSDTQERLKALKQFLKTLPDMKIPKLTNTNYDEFLTAVLLDQMS